MTPGGPRGSLGGVGAAPVEARRPNFVVEPRLGLRRGGAAAAGLEKTPAAALARHRTAAAAAVAIRGPSTASRDSIPYTGLPFGSHSWAGGQHHQVHSDARGEGRGRDCQRDINEQSERERERETERERQTRETTGERDFATASGRFRPQVGRRNSLAEAAGTHFSRALPKYFRSKFCEIARGTHVRWPRVGGGGRLVPLLSHSPPCPPVSYHPALPMLCDSTRCRATARHNDR